MTLALCGKFILVIGPHQNAVYLILMYKDGSVLQVVVIMVMMPIVIILDVTLMVIFILLFSKTTQSLLIAMIIGNT